VAKRAKVSVASVVATWATLLEQALPGEGDFGKIDVEVIAAGLDLEESEVQSIVDAMFDKGLIEGTTISNWRKRQPGREDDKRTQRTREFRERKKAESEAELDLNPPENETQRNAMKCNEMHGNAPDSDSDSDSERKERGREDSRQTERKKASALTRVIPPDDGFLIDAVNAFNERAAKVGWPQAQRLTEPRKASLRKRLEECGGLSGWTEAMERASKSPFLCGSSDRGWRASLDFFLQARSFTKLMEGAYDERTGRSANRSSDEFRRAFERVGERLGLREPGGSDNWPDNVGRGRGPH
jgi:hypothetical protein